MEQTSDCIAQRSISVFDRIIDLSFIEYVSYVTQFSVIGQYE